MAKNENKTLLNEGTIRRMMKLANMESLGNGFITEKYTGEKAGDEGAGAHKDDTDYAGKGMRKGDESDTGRGEDFVKEESEMEAELSATEDELGAEDEVADEEAAEIESEVTITDDEAQDIINLADKLKGAVSDDEPGEEDPVGDMEMDISGEEEVDIEEPGMRATAMYEEELYEAALKGLEIDLVDDSKPATLQQVKEAVYKKVINRLLKEAKK
jgi:hypothetical protein|tara:strand:+ start:1050 stop:1694 length:645 start_codon:yes stop_codon:yes gene_type:complete